jgi:hypothetical protein
MMLPAIMSCSSLPFIKVCARIPLRIDPNELNIQFPTGLEAEGWYINGVLRGSLTNSAVAIKSLHDMRCAPGFDRKMLLLATQISHQMESKGVLLFVLEALLETLVAGSEAACSETVVEAMTLIRCIIRLVLKLMSDQAANQ